MIPGPPVWPPPPAVPLVWDEYLWLAALATFPVLLLYALSARVVLPERGTTMIVVVASGVLWQLALAARYPDQIMVLPLYPMAWIILARHILRPSGIAIWNQDLRTPLEWLVIVQALVFFWMLWHTPPRIVVAANWLLLGVQWLAYHRWDRLVSDGRLRERTRHWFRQMGWSIQEEVRVRPAAAPRPIVPLANSLGTPKRADTAEQIRQGDRRSPRVPFGEID